ncbi:MAG: NUDIX hydrolase [Pirellulaceae bacterium]
MIDPLGDGLPAMLAQRLCEPLPGPRAQRLLTSELAYGRHVGPPLWNARNAAVLVLLYPRDDGWCLPLTERPGHMVDHAGQISLPGGTSECDESSERCALREYAEELGAPLEDVHVVGRLSPLYVFASNFWVTPCVAVTSECPICHPNAVEVARVIELRLPHLWDPANRSAHVIERRGIRFRARDILCGEDRIWGATGMILAELADVTAQVLGVPYPPVWADWRLANADGSVY